MAGPAARARIAALEPGEILLLDNLRFLTEEVSTFEAAVKLTPAEMTQTYLVRNLAPLFDVYVNDAFAAAHRGAPSMVAFQQLMPSAGGRLLSAELEALEAVAGNPARPCLFVLGGLKISDAFSMLQQVLTEGTADEVLTTGITGQVMLLAAGHSLGAGSEQFIADRSLDVFIPEAREYLRAFPGKIHMPVDVAVERRRATGRDRRRGSPGARADRRHRQRHDGRLRGADRGGCDDLRQRPGRGLRAREQRRGNPSAVGGRRRCAGTSVIGGGDTVSSAGRFIDPVRSTSSQPAAAP